MGVKDGVFDVSGRRVVKKGGRIKHFGTWYYHPKLEEMVGEDVYVYGDDVWVSSHLNVHRCLCLVMGRGKRDKYVPDGWICDANLVEDSP